MTNIGSNLELDSHEISYSPETGVRTLLGYEGTREAVVGYAFQLPTESNWHTSDSDKPKVRLNVSFPYLFAGQNTPEQAIDTWEFPTNTIQKDYREHPDWIGFSAVMRRIIEIGLDDINQLATPENVESKINTVYVAINAVSGATAEQKANAIVLFEALMRVPNLTFQVSQLILRHTRVIGTKAALAMAWSNIHKVYTQAQIHAESPIDAEHLATLENIPVVTPHSGYFWGWLKQTPAQKKIAYGKLEITNEWWLEEWLTFLYPTI